MNSHSTGIRVFFLFLGKLHNLSYWERKDFTICEYAKVRRKIMQPFFFSSANLAKKIIIFMIILVTLWVRIESFGEHYLGLHSKLVINNSLFWL
jgi:hypothetical protein